MGSGERTLIIIFLFTLVLINPMIRGDGWGYFSHLRSMVVDFDLDYSNEYEHANPKFKETAGKLPPTELGRTRNVWPIGCSLLWMPFYIPTHLVITFLKALGFGISNDGYGLPYRISIALSSALIAFAGLFLSYRIASRLIDERGAFISTITIWFASSLPAYMYFHPSHSHACTVFTSALLFYLLLDAKEKGDSHRRWFLIGAVVGLATMVRLADSVLIASALTILVWRAVKERGWGRYALNLFLLIAGFMVAMIPQFIVWRRLNGSFFTTGYEYFPFDFKSPHIWGVLFSTYHGIFSWTPVLLIAVAGLIIAIVRIRERFFYIVALLPFACFTYIQASYHDWHQVSSFGGRAFITYTPVFIFGLAFIISQVLRWVRLRWIVIISAVLIVWNLGLLFQFAIGMIPRDAPISFREVVVNYRDIPVEAYNFARDYFSGRSELRERFYYDE